MALDVATVAVLRHCSGWLRDELSRIPQAASKYAGEGSDFHRGARFAADMIDCAFAPLEKAIETAITENK